MYKSNLLNLAADVIDDADDVLSRRSRELKNATRSARRVLKKRYRAGREYVEDASEHLSDRIPKFVRSRPVISVGIAVAVLLAAKLLYRK
jgi:ElaB/YqjD/DUF883 family membrane-anchored ribosome-binding protein